ncbi:hypothetical protein KD050_19070 [Psychrobacillus sp. INOP01]|uniref:hypothetical protein n=1 Tax=Psychrobacillus sp. INOP01 TaxID=2829187 RepID=UPI001BA7A266|nr:hypothetical protein [Psychrobacillus sp. INOP01]QUG41351.1 hypothetical protein KD050_19070 [Psychrobacillus sp. INOP01]
MNKLLVLLATVFLLSACGDESVEPITIKSIIGSITKEEFNVYEDKGIFLIKIDYKDAHEASKSAMLKDTMEILADLSKLDEVKSVLIKWNANLTDDYGNKSFDELLAVVFDADTFAKVNWENYKTLDLESIASEYTQHSTLKD